MKIKSFEEACKVLGIDERNYLGIIDITNNFLSHLDTRMRLYYKLSIISNVIEKSSLGDKFSYLALVQSITPDKALRINEDNILIGSILDFTDMQQKLVFGTVYRLDNNVVDNVQEFKSRFDLFKEADSARYFLKNFGRDCFDYQSLISYRWLTITPQEG